MRKLLSMAAVLVAISLLGAEARALDETQARKNKKKITSAALPEMPAVVARLVLETPIADREAVALDAVQTAISKSPASAPMVVAAIAKAAPELTDAVVKKAVQLEPGQTSSISLAANGRGSGRSGVAQGNGQGNSGNGRGNGGGRGNATGHSGEHNPGPPLPNSPPHHNRPDHPLGGPPGLVDYSKPRNHH